MLVHRGAVVGDAAASVVASPCHPAILNFILIEYAGNALRERRPPRTVDENQKKGTTQIRVANTFNMNVPLGIVKNIRVALQHYTCRGLLDLAAKFAAEATNKFKHGEDVCAALSDVAKMLENEAIRAAGQQLS